MIETVDVKAPKVTTEYEVVTMEDGRKVSFPGKRKMTKETLIDEGKIEIDEAGGLIQMQRGAVSVRIDFRNGLTRTFTPPLSLYARGLGHGWEQKMGDEVATTADKPLSEDDMAIAMENLDSELQKGLWGRGRTAGGGGVAGAHIVLQAIMEATGKDLVTVKEYVKKRLDAELLKPEDERISRKAFYDSFRVKGTKTGVIIERMEADKIAKSAKLDANAELAMVGA